MKRDTNKTMMMATHQLVEASGCYDKVGAIMDYFLPESYEIQELTNYEFDFITKVNFGGSEGIYIDCYIEGKYDDSGNTRLKCGTYKTLNDDLKAMQIIGELAGALTYYNRQYVNKEIDRYTPNSEHTICINCSMDMLEKMKDFTRKHRHDHDADKNVLLSVKIAKQLSDERFNGKSGERFSFEEISKIEQALNESKDKTKIYRTKDGQNYSLEPILNDGKYCSEKECDVAGIYSVPKEINIIISGGRLRFEDYIYLVDNNGEPAIKMGKGDNVKWYNLKKSSVNLCLTDIEKKIEKYRNSDSNNKEQISNLNKIIER